MNHRKQCIILATIVSCVTLVGMLIVMSLIYLFCQQHQVEFQQLQVEFQQHQVEFQQLQVEFQQLQHRITFLEKCNKPTAITDGNFTPDQTTYEHNQTIQLLCTDTTTHTATGSSTSRCINGNFDPVIDFKCISNAVKCGLFSDIADEQLTASSVYRDDPRFEPQHGRLFSTSGNGGWLAETYKGSWIQVDFGTDVNVTGIRTQGRYTYDQWVTSYSVSFQRGTDKSFSYIEDKSGKTVIFDGNTDKNTVVAHIFDGPVSARYIRIHPVTYHSYPVMRFDVLTC